YVFSWTIETYGQRTEAVLLVNDVQQALSRADQASSYYDTTTSFAVLNLTLNDKININVTMGSAQAMHTMFSGWKINKTDDTAFSASLSREVNGSTIVFNNETLDTDSAYSTSTGRFVAPRSGLYVFMMSATTDGSSDFYTKFVFSNGNSQQKAGSWLLIQMQLNQITQYF
uniref:C1q domain-containing protein n=1 Tax=Magallana gigas TaxID=29159 RepID=A0A8W8I8Q9_MAGGI